MSFFGPLVAQYFDYNTLKIMHLFGVVIFM